MIDQSAAFSLVDVLNRVLDGAVANDDDDLMALGRITGALGLTSIDPVLIAAACDSLYERNRDLNNQLGSKQEEVHKAEVKLEALQETNAELRQWIAELDAGRADRLKQEASWRLHSEMLAKKRSEYSARLVELNRIPSPTRAPDVEAALQRRDRAREQYKELARKLQPYHSLPADWTLAQIEVARLERQLADLLQTRDRILGGLRL